MYIYTLHFPSAYVYQFSCKQELFFSIDDTSTSAVSLSMATQCTTDVAANNKSKCEESKRKLEQIIIDFEDFDFIQYFFHATKKEHKAAITKSRRLEKRTKLKYKELKGVSFCCTVYKGDLPTQSPYGAERICIPVEYFLSGNPHLFYNSCKEEPGNPTFYYVTLVLVKESDREFSFCKENLVELSMTRNSFLRINRSEKRYRCFSNERCYRKFKVFVEVFVVGDVRLPFWDQVIDTGRSRRGV